MRRAASSPDAQDILTSVVILPFIIRVNIDELHIDLVVLSDLTGCFVNLAPCFEELTLCRSALINLLTHLTYRNISSITGHTELPL